MVTPFGSESACSFCFGVVCVLDIQRPSQILFVVFFSKKTPLRLISAADSMTFVSLKLFRLYRREVNKSGNH